MIVVAVVLGSIGWLAPPGRSGGTAAGTVADGLDIVSWRPFAPTVEVEQRTVGGTPADVYEPDGDAPTVLLVPGAVPAGRDDPRVRQLAYVLARGDRRVVVPELAVYDERLVQEDVDRLVQAVTDLSSPTRPVVLVGISFGGSLSIVAAADERLEGRVAGVATFGAFADLIGVAQAATTGVSLVDGRRVPWDADPRAEEVVRQQLVSLLPDRDAAAVRASLTSDLPTERLSADARAVHDLLANEDPERTYQLARALPPRIRRRLEVVSPTAVAGDLRDLPIVAMHSREDPVIPYGELRRLGAALPHARVLTVDSLQHADLRISSPGGWVGALDDLATVWTFTASALRWQEPSWPWRPG